MNQNENFVHSVPNLSDSLRNPFLPERRTGMNANPVNYTLCFLIFFK